MNLIKEVKNKVDIVDVAKKYGIIVNRKNKALCCFHTEKTPSLSFHNKKQIFKCFSCGKGGDCISLVAGLLNINNYEAAKSINKNMGLGLDNVKTNFGEINQYKNRNQTENSFGQWENQTFQLLCNYLHLLWKWEKEDSNSDLYIEAMHNKNYIDYLIDEIFIYGSIEDKIWFYKNNKKLIQTIKNKLNTL